MRPSKEQVQERERLAESGLKRCSVRSGCGEIKPIDEFGADKGNWDNKLTICRICNRKRVNKYYKENGEAKRAYSRQHYLDNREANREANNAYARQYYLDNIEEKREYSRTHSAKKRQDDPMYGRLQDGRMRAKKAGVELDNISSTELLSHWKQRDITIDTCHYCKKTIDEDELHIDHGTPIGRGGGHILDNLFPSHKRCNLSKGKRTVEEYLEHLMQAV